MPLESGWSKGPRKTWAELKKQYTHGYNLGVRLGKASRFEDGTYLGVIDCDVKSDDPKHEKEMLARLAELIELGGPEVSSGRGNGSRHLYVRVKEPRAGYRFAQSAEKVRCLMPGVAASSSDRRQLKEHEIKEGYRWRAAWEISVMGEGQQVVLPPSVHPDTGNTYEWMRPLVVSRMRLLEQSGAPAKKADLHAGTSEDFKPVEVDLVSSELPDSTIDLILKGTNCSDDSAGLFAAAIAMQKARFSESQILTVLTDRDTHLGRCAYRHANTTSRKRAATWVKRFTLDKVRAEFSAQALFADTVKIDDDQEVARLEALREERPDDGWKAKIERQGDGPNARPRTSFKNLKLILCHAVSPKFFRRDLFARRMTYTMVTPWGGVTGEPVQDIDAIRIKDWCAEHYRFEPPVNLVHEVIERLGDQNAYHPIRDMLNSLAEWDGTPRVDTWLRDHFGAKGPDTYLGEVLFKFLAGMISRVLNPGVQFDWMLILEGEQGVGKSTFARELAGDAYFADWLPDLADKDAAQLLQGTWLVEMGELAQLRKNEIETVKAFVTRRVDKYRPSFGRATIEAPRQSVFMGTTNASQYLRDDTGNRRFIPVMVGNLDVKALRRDRNQLLAEVLWAYRNITIRTLELEGEALEYSKQLQSERMVKDDSNVMAEQFSEWIKKQSEDSAEAFDESKFKLLTLFGPLGPWHLWRADGRTTQLGAKALRFLGYDHRRIKGETFWKR
jgi:hypothetical protein